MIQVRVNCIIFIVSLFMPFVSCCLPTGHVGGEIPITTEAPIRMCPTMANLAQVFFASNTVSIRQAEVYGSVTPAQTCLSCDNGQVNYYTSATQAAPHATTPLEAAGSLSAMNCPNMCICANDGTCYRPTSNDVVATFWPYCSGGTCGVYVYITAQNDDNGLVSTTGSPTFTSGAQIVQTTSLPKPVTDSSYFAAATASCDGCVSSACQTTEV